MSLVKEGVKTLFGPGSKPELVEECALSVLLEIEPMLRSCLQQSNVGGRDIVHDKLNDIVNTTSLVTAKLRSTTKHENVKRLLKNDKHQALVQHAVRSNWQAIEDDVMITHAENVCAEKALVDRYALLYFGVLRCTLLCNTVLCCATLYSAVLCCTILYSAVLHCILLYFTVFCCTILQYVAYYCWVQYCT